MSRRAALIELEAEAIYVLRECAANFDRVAILFSGGKDSLVVAQLALRAFAPIKCPFRLLHIDTGHNFHETLRFRDEYAATNGFGIEIRQVQDSIDAGKVVEETGPYRSRNALQTVTLLDAIQELKLDAVIGGARRDEEKSRAKERFFSHRNQFGQWEPRAQRPEVWRTYNCRKRHGEHFRVFPLNNWTETDVWEYIEWRQLPVPSLYFSHEREVFKRGSVWLANSEFIERLPEENVEVRRIRFRTVGDATCTGAVDSLAANVSEVIAELATFGMSERSTRADDQRSESAMEDRKRQGYF